MAIRRRLLTRGLAVLGLALVCVVTIAADEPKPRPSASPSAAPSREPVAQLANVRIGIKITDTRASAEPVTKRITMTVGDRESGMIRSTERVSGPSGPFEVPLHIDVQPRIEGNKVRLRLSLEYTILDAAKDGRGSAVVKDSLGLVLQDGQPLVVAESADPLSERRVTLEVTATILR